MFGNYNRTQDRVVVDEMSIISRNRKQFGGGKNEMHSKCPSTK